MRGLTIFGAESDTLWGEVWVSFGHGLISWRSPCPPNRALRALEGILNGHGLSVKNRPCPKGQQSLPKADGHRRREVQEAVLEEVFAGGLGFVGAGLGEARAVSGRSYSSSSEPR